MTYFITENEMKSDGLLNKNIEQEYIKSAIVEAQTIYLKEILGDALYNAVETKIEGETLDGKYEVLVNDYIKPYLRYKVVSCMVVPTTFKLRNTGITSQYSGEITTTGLDETKYMENYYNGKAEFFSNRMIDFLVKNRKDIVEYKYSKDNITNPRDTNNVCTFYLG